VTIRPKGCAAAHANHPDVCAALSALEGLQLADTTDFFGFASTPGACGVLVQPADDGKVVIYWSERGHHRGQDGTPFTAELKVIADKLREAGWKVEPRFKVRLSARRPGSTTPQDRQIRHALNALARTTPGRRRAIQAAAENYLSQINRHRLPVGYNQPIPDDRINRADAYRMRQGSTLTRMLGISCHPTDEHLPATARAVLAAIDAPIRHLANAATTTGEPVTVAVAYLVYGPALLALASTPAAPPAVPRQAPLTAATLPKSEALAKQALADAEDAFWDHAEDCMACFEGANKPIVQGLCPHGWGWWRARNCAADTANNWREYDRWLRGGGYANWAANDWIA